MCFCECSSWFFFSGLSRARSVRSRWNQAGLPSPVWPTLAANVRVAPRRGSLLSESVRQKTSWRIVPDDLRPTPQRCCKEATAAGPCSSRAGVLRREAASAARRPSPLLSWLLLVGSEPRLRGAPQPRIVGSPAHRLRQPKLLGLTVAGSHPRRSFFRSSSLRGSFCRFICYYHRSRMSDLVYT